MSKFLDELFRLDEKGQSQELILTIDFHKRSLDVLQEITAHLANARFLQAYILSRLFVGAGLHHAITALGQSVGGFLFGHAEDEANGAAALSDMIDLIAPQPSALFFNGLLQPVVASLVMQDASLVQDQAKALRLLNILKAGSLEFRSMFDWTAEVSALSPDHPASREAKREKLIDFAGVPDGVPRRAVRALVAMRELVFPGKADSRLYDMGLRVCAAMTAYGWQTSFLPLTLVNCRADFAQIIARCVEEKPDVLFFDDYPIKMPGNLQGRSVMIAQLRALLPDLKLVPIHLDPWDILPDHLIFSAGPVDAVWAHFPSMEIWRHPAFAGKMIFVPLPHAGQSGIPTTKMTDRMTFAGGVFGYNWHRLFWLAGRTHGLPLDAQLSSHDADGLSVLESYAAYMRRVEATAISVNFSMRPDLSRILTGRFFETVLAGALLVQEETPDMDYYFVDGEHFLSFRSVPELRAIARFVAEQPEQAEAIRRRGNEFARARYNDKKLIGYVDKLLFYPD